MEIIIKGAREHNLKNIDLKIGDGLTVVTGVSGSGKTSLVFDTLYHEARRRMYDVISLGRPGGWRHQLAPARVEEIHGLGPSIAVEQNVLNRNPNSTLATASGLHPFLRLLYSNFGSRHCVECGTSLQVYSEDEIVERLGKISSVSSARVYVPLMRNVPGSHRTLLEMLADQFSAASIFVDREPLDERRLDPEQAHDIDVYIGTLQHQRTLAECRRLVHDARAMGGTTLIISKGAQNVNLNFAPVCTDCGTWFAELEPRYFHMDCPLCRGDGCRTCSGSGIHPLAYAVSWEEHRLPDLLALTVDCVGEIIADCDLPATADRLLWEIARRVDALKQVGLGYLSLDRPSPSLSRGESQRVRLAVSLTSRLEDMLHVLDEPTIGQHSADVARFLPALKALPGPVVFVEHDRLAASIADRVLDLGPGAGVEGGHITYSGTPAGLLGSDTPTGLYFSQRIGVIERVPAPPADQYITLEGINRHNLRDLEVSFPVARLTVITGVSGSGKSTLVEHVLYPTLKGKKATGCEAYHGKLLKPVLVDQNPIGRNPRSNPATYTKLSDLLRELYARVSGLTVSHFSFNRPEGACPACKGMGAVEVKMQYLYSFWIPCEDCEGMRFNEQVLNTRILFDDRLYSIAEFYRLSISEAAELLKRENRLPENRLNGARRILRALTDVGLGYMELGQPSPTLSGGEAQRVKLTRYLGRKMLKDQLLILDEPSTGLHPQDLDGLLVVLDRLVSAGATIVLVEHNLDLIRAADWIIDLGPGAGPEGGQLLFSGPANRLIEIENSRTGQALRDESAEVIFSDHERDAISRTDVIRILKARANNLVDVDVEIPKGVLTVVTGLSGSGKSSLIKDVLEAEAHRRYLESLSMYERQGTHEGAEAPVDSISGLGVTLSVSGLQTHRWSALSHFTRRASVGKVSELSHHLAVLLAELGERTCQNCGGKMTRAVNWNCDRCGELADVAGPRCFSTTHYGSACENCTGVGVIFKPQPDKLIVHPEKPLCRGAMYSPGYWPETYLCKDTGIIQALAARYHFDPHETPWREMSMEARGAFLYGDDQPMEVTYRSKSTGKRAGKLITHTVNWEGFYGGWVKDWDVHGTYTRTVPCPACGGAGLKAEHLAVALCDYNFHQLSEISLGELLDLLDNRLILPDDGSSHIRTSLSIARRRLRFLCKVGLGYLNLNRPTGTLSAGEAQRIQLAGLLGSELTSLTVLLDEPTRGMHPAELDALGTVLLELRDQGNTLVIIEHDEQIIRLADHVIELGPGAGKEGGQIVTQGSINKLVESNTWTGKLLRGEILIKSAAQSRLDQEGWKRNGVLSIRGARENNLQNLDIEIPLNALVGVCGVSGSGKSTLLIDTLGRALVRQKHTTSFANERIDPGLHDVIDGSPGRVLLVDQSRKEIRSPARYLGLVQPMLKVFAASGESQALGLDERQLRRPCTTCKGRGLFRMEMGFLPDSLTSCETCKGTGYSPEAWQVRINGISLPEVNLLTLDEVLENFSEQEKIVRSLLLTKEVGLGYLTWNQPGYSLSGGEAQRLKIVKQLRKKSIASSLFILDEPTVGQHMEDTRRLVQVLRRLVVEGHSVILIEHHVHVLAACDWLIELGPGGGVRGGRVIASGTPVHVAGLDTPTAPYLREVLGAGR